MGCGGGYYGTGTKGRPAAATNVARAASLAAIRVTRAADRYGIGGDAVRRSRPWRCCRTACCDTGCSSCSSCSGGGCQDCQGGGGGYHESHGEMIHEMPHQPRELGPKPGPAMPQERVAPPPVPPMTRGPAELNSRAVRSSPLRHRSPPLSVARVHLRSSPGLAS